MRCSPRATRDGRCQRPRSLGHPLQTDTLSRLAIKTAYPSKVILNAALILDLAPAP